MKPLVCLTILVLATAAVAQQPPEPKPTPGISVIHFVAPKYPPLARTAQIQGDVRLLVQIAPDGGAKSVTVLSGHPMLALAALDAVKQWHFGCQRCEESLSQLLTVTFRLTGDPLSDCDDSARAHVEPNLPQQLAVETKRGCAIIDDVQFVDYWINSKSISDIILDRAGPWLGGSDAPRATSRR
jgi:TonB family protein